MADVYLPSTLQPLFAGLPRHVAVDAGTVDGAIATLEERWPGLRDRLCEPGPPLRRHIHVYVDGERAGAADVPDDGINGCATRQLRFGADQGGGQRLTGALDRAAIFPDLLEPDEIDSWQERAFG